MSDRHFDVVIVGSGLGGLQCAYILASEGFSVCVLEQNVQLGGNLQVFSRDKAIFDTGVHYIGGLDPGQNLHRYFSYFQLMDKLKLIKMDEDGFDHISFEGDPTTYHIAQGYENFVDQLCVHFPKHRAALNTYCNRLKQACETFPLYNLEYREGGELDDRLLSLNAKQEIEAMIDDPTLRNIVGGNNALYAGRSATTPFYVHALVTNTYVESSYRCIDGGSQIAKHLARNARGHGAVIQNRKRVTGFEMGDNGISAVLTEDGDRFSCGRVVANIHPSVLIGMLDPSAFRNAYRKRVTNLENSISCFTLHLCMEPDSFPYLNHNVYHYDLDDVWEAYEYDEATWPTLYMISTPRTTRGGEYADAISIMSYMRYDEVAKWADTHNNVKQPNSRGTEYEDWKKVKEQVLLAKVMEKFPELKGKINSMHSSTPLTIRDYTGSPDGSAYGVMKNSNDPLRSFLTPRTRVPNLLLTGQNINLHGILGVTVSSVVTCSEVLGKEYLVRKIQRAS